MGYYMTQTEASFFIADEDKPKALEAIKSLAGKETWGDHFSWVSSNFKKARTLNKAMHDWRWNILLDEGNNVVNIEFCGEKFGDDQLLFSTIAPFVKSDSYISMRGEDGAQWRWVFKNGQCKEIHAKIVWEEE